MKRKQYKSVIAGALIVLSVIIVFYVYNNTGYKIFPFENSNQYNYASYQQKNLNNQFITSGRQNIITETVKNISPSVVGINVIEIRQYRDPFGSFFDDPFFRQFFGDRGNYNQKVKGLGSGFIISPDGYIITNDHVAGSATEITVTMTNGEHYDARIIGTDPVSDICLLKIDEENLPYAPLGSSDDIIIGEWVIALGNPFGLFDLNDKPTVTVGVISATGMNLEPLNNRYYLNMLQTDAAINGGNSGGPLVNSIGEVIGMNTLIYTAGASQGNIGLSFAIPVNKVKRIVSELKESGKIERDFDVGLRIQSLDEKIAEYYNLSTSRGVIITQVASGSPADKAGLKVGDIILEVENYKINNEQTLIGVFQEFRTGQTVSLKIVREEETLSKRMALVKR
jgi:serine protease Do